MRSNFWEFTWQKEKGVCDGTSVSQLHKCQHKGGGKLSTDGFNCSFHSLGLASFPIPEGIFLAWPLWWGKEFPLWRSRCEILHRRVGKVENFLWCFWSHRQQEMRSVLYLSPVYYLLPVHYLSPCSPGIWGLFKLHLPSCWILLFADSWRVLCLVDFEVFRQRAGLFWGTLDPGWWLWCRWHFYLIKRGKEGVGDLWKERTFEGEERMI